MGRWHRAGPGGGVLVALAVMLAGCGGSHGSFRRFPHHEYSPREKDHPIRHYYFKRPECPFDEIATAVAEAGNTEDAMVELEKQARLAGGDGLAIMVYMSDVVTGTVIRFTDPDCTD